MLFSANIFTFLFAALANKIHAFGNKMQDYPAEISENLLRFSSEHAK
jgi:hypothetical protein